MTGLRRYRETSWKVWHGAWNQPHTYTHKWRKKSIPSEAILMSRTAIKYFMKLWRKIKHEKNGIIRCQFLQENDVRFFVERSVYTARLRAPSMDKTSRPLRLIFGKTFQRPMPLELKNSLTTCCLLQTWTKDTRVWSRQQPTNFAGFGYQKNKLE